MATRFFGYDPVLGIERWFHSSDDGESFTIETRQDSTQLLDANKALYNDAPVRFGNQMWTRVAQLPMNLWHELKQKGILDDDAEMKKWLNDPDNRFFRTRPGRL